MTTGKPATSPEPSEQAEGQRRVEVRGDDTHEAVRAWKAKVAAARQRKARFETMSGLPVADLYVPDRITPEYLERIGLPGEYPFTRGPYPTMYRGRLWTMRMFAGFGTPEDTNRRFRFLLEEGQTGLSTAFDMPTLMGYDPDHPLARGEVGREGVSVSSIDDMRILFDGIPLGEVSTSMTINAPAIVLLALYVAVAQEQNVPPERIRGTLQNDILKEFIAQKEWISPPRPSMRIIQDMLVYCARHLPKFHPISISGYHIREAGATAVQELAFTLADGIAYVEAGIAAGLHPDEFAPRLSFFFDVHNDFFEEIAKLRAARRIWARLMRERFGARNPRSWTLRTHCQTAGVSLTAQQPTNNVVRVAIQALAAVLGGTQSLHTNAMDETYCLPTEETARLALRTQQIIAGETNVAQVIDPLAGSYFVEDLTDRMEAAAMEYIRKIDEMGGMLEAVERGYPQREIADSAFRDQQKVEAGERTIVGINAYREEEAADIPLLKIDLDKERAQIERVRRRKAARDAAAVRRHLEAVRQACRGTDNLVYPILDAVKAGVTLGEICDVFRDEFGVYRDPGYL